MKHRLVISLILLTLTGPVLAEKGFIISPKIGLQDWADDVHTLAGNTITFDPQASIGVEGGYQFGNGFTVTGELMASSHEAKNETAGTNRGTVAESSLVAMASYYFRNDKSFKPFIGVGVGTYAIEISDSNTNATLDGFTAQARIGALLQINEKLSINFEFKHYNIDVDDENNLAIKTDAYFIGGGATWRF